MDIFPDWLGQTGGAGVPYPVLVQGLDLLVECETMALVVDDLDAALAMTLDAPALSLELISGVELIISDSTIDLEVDGG